jgi:hypothetical protein
MLLPLYWYCKVRTKANSVVVSFQIPTVYIGQSGLDSCLTCIILDISVVLHNVIYYDCCYIMEHAALCTLLQLSKS